MSEEKLIHVSILVPGIDIPLELDFSRKIWSHIEAFATENNISTEEAITLALYNELCDDDDEEIIDAEYTETYEK